MLPLSVQTARHEEMAAPWYAFDEENEHFLSLGEEIIIYSIYIYRVVIPVLHSGFIDIVSGCSTILLGWSSMQLTSPWKSRNRELSSDQNQNRIFDSADERLFNSSLLEKSLFSYKISHFLVGNANQSIFSVPLVKLSPNFLYMVLMPPYIPCSELFD